MLPNYTSLKEKLNMNENQEAETLHLCKQLLEAAEECEVRVNYASIPAKLELGFLI